MQADGALDMMRGLLAGVVSFWIGRCPQPHQKTKTLGMFFPQSPFPSTPEGHSISITPMKSPQQWEEHEQTNMDSQTGNAVQRPSPNLFLLFAQVMSTCQPLQTVLSSWGPAPQDPH